MSKQFTYAVADGKHQLADGSFVKAGETLSMTEEEAARFPGKFKLVTAPVEADEEAEAEAKATTPATAKTTAPAADKATTPAKA